jgi:hypothetical protein
MKPDTKAELAHWIRRRLGAPLVDAMIESSQMEDCIDFACDWFSEHAGGVGHEEQIILIRTRTAEENNELRSSVSSTTDTTAPSGNTMIWASEYQLPKCVFALSHVLEADRRMTGNREPIERALNYADQFGMTAGLAGGNSMGGAMGFFYPGATSISSGYGSPGGQGTRPAGGGIDLVSYEIGMQYMEMIRQQYTVKINAQFLEQKRTVRFSPAPSARGLLALAVWSRVYDEYLYDNLWVKQYALALAKKQIGYNTKKYTGITFPGGGSIDGDFYLSEGKEEIQKLEEEIANNMYNYPPGFFVG